MHCSEFLFSSTARPRPAFSSQFFEWRENPAGVVGVRIGLVRSAHDSLGRARNTYNCMSGKNKKPPPLRKKSVWPTSAREQVPRSQGKAKRRAGPRSGVTTGATGRDGGARIGPPASPSDDNPRCPRYSRTA